MAEVSALHLGTMPGKQMSTMIFAPGRSPRMSPGRRRNLERESQMPSMTRDEVRRSVIAGLASFINRWGSRRTRTVDDGEAAYRALIAIGDGPSPRSSLARRRRGSGGIGSLRVEEASLGPTSDPSSSASGRRCWYRGFLPRAGGNAHAAPHFVAISALGAIGLGCGNCSALSSPRCIGGHRRTPPQRRGAGDERLPLILDLSPG